MTSELEQKFYDTFGIEPNSKWHKCKDYNCIYCDEYEFCSRREFVYPKITAEKLLQMICILNETACEVLAAENIEDLKNEILETCIKVYNTPILTSDGDEYDNNAIYDKIQQLFKD